MTRRTAFAVALLLVGCGPRANVEILFSDFLDVAEKLNWTPSSPGSDEPGSFRQSAGSVLSWYFPVPERGRLVGEARLQEGEVAQEVIVTLLDETGAFRELRRQEIAPGETVSLDEDLGEFAGRLARIRTGLARAGAPSDAAVVRWDRLRLEGVEPPPAPAAPPPDRAYNVLLVVFDTLRADRLSAYGETRVATPTLSRLAAGGAVFEHAISNATYTTPSVASMLTSVHPTLHRAGGLPLLGGNPMLPDGLPTLPELLKEQGYATLFVVSNLMVSEKFGFGRGFDRVADRHDLRERLVLPPGATPESEAASVWDDHIAPFLADFGGRPFFIYLHEIDPHDPYAPPEPWSQLYTDPDYRGPANGSGGNDPPRQFRALAERKNPSPEYVRELNGLYDGEVTFGDEYLGHILDRLDEAGLAESTLVVFVSDHGELIGEHGLFGHGHHATEEIVRVPMIFSLPGVVPAVRVSSPVELLDVAPTILDLVGVEAPETMRGRSLVPMIADPDRASDPTRHPIFTTGHFPGRFSLHSVHYGGWKLVRRNAGPEEGLESDRYLLYDLVHDPGETRNVWKQAPVVAGALRQMLETRIRDDDAANPWKNEEVVAEPLAPDALEKLRALGYVD